MPPSWFFLSLYDSAYAGSISRLSRPLPIPLVIPWIDRLPIKSVASPIGLAASHFSVCLRVFAIPVHCLGADPEIAGKVVWASRVLYPGRSPILLQLTLQFGPQPDLCSSQKCPSAMLVHRQSGLDSPLRKSAPARVSPQALTGARGRVPGRHSSTGASTTLEHRRGSMPWTAILAD
ncbi:uncharacterized protein LY79DRAFT_164253 [Colletotrichum navitas]|uniref:Uncharacterized protein n=1 Tax=Colletotrichum navitas TaxID=681940 RepID=A0AAD8Q156_9PEZI|nr:uncharacterized protein LY79DRAFT_164253 [Colletotrichum navitas]KAK1593925.1 hypothetical protein LY79DRAFT_164253 [Colletotrichum navitas]